MPLIRVLEPFDHPDWLFELKHDGFRMLGARSRNGCRLYYRRGGDAGHGFPDVLEALRAVPAEDFVLDAELVVLDGEGRSSFQSLQKRFQLLRRPDIESAARRLPATLFAFDLLGLAGHDLRPLPLRERKRLLRGLLPPDCPVRYADHVEESGEAFYEEVRKRGLEGIVAKRAGSPYRAGRWADWLKVRVDRTADFVVVGFSEPQGARAGFGALHLAWHDAGTLVYAGRVGSGFDGTVLAGVRSVLDLARRPDCPCDGPAPSGPGHHWVEPRLVCEVRYKEWTEEGLLRQPVFLRFRTDKRAEECVRDRAVAAGTRRAPGGSQ
jgi:bifunctional non-homologous end joining protein LigD